MNKTKNAVLGAFALLSLVSLAPTVTLAGGSVGFEDQAVPLLRREPELLRFVRDSLEVARVGGAVRLGKDFGERVGERITPFTFEARPKGSDGPYTLLLIINSPEGLSGGNSTNTVSIEIRPLPKTESKGPR